MYLYRTLTKEFIGEANTFVGIQYLIESYLRSDNFDCHNFSYTTYDNKVRVDYTYNYRSEQPTDGSIEFYIRE